MARLGGSRRAQTGPISCGASMVVGDSDSCSRNGMMAASAWLWTREESA